ncbi:MAG: YicC family protein [Candidatus Omnitrophica bacterium]|nr:YicC family protein [Candidatus Omnitrophota bacterium]
MIQSMTGFGSSHGRVLPFGKMTVELRSANHKFLETIFHLPVGFLSLEDKIKKCIESKTKRGRVTCAINIAGGEGSGVAINKALLKNYIRSLKKAGREFGIKDDLSLNTLMHLPGVLSLEEGKVPAESIWPRLKVLVERSVKELARTRAKEGKALFVFLKRRAQGLKEQLEIIKTRNKKITKDKLAKLQTDDERCAFLKDANVSEEIERLAFHIRNFSGKLAKAGSVGKELDFIAQEMQREANTLAAKTLDTQVSARVVQMKSQIEKIREQVQNIE